MILGGYEQNQNQDIRNVNLVYISGSLPSSQGNFALLTVPGTMQLTISGKDTVAGAHQIWYGSSQVCREVWLNVSADMYLTKASGTGEIDNTWGVKLEQDIVYKIPVANSNSFYLSGSGTVFWTIFS